MKKNIYEILEDTNGKRLDELTDGIEYEIPDGISLENVKSKVFAKTGAVKQKKKASRAVFIRYGAIAACFALLLCAYPAVKMLSSDSTELGKQVETGTYPAGFGVTPDTSTGELLKESAYESQMTYRYFYPSEDGSIVSASFTEKLTDGKSAETMQSHMDRFFKLCGIKDITVVDSTVDDSSKTEYSEFEGEGVVTHTAGVKTLILTIEGEAELSEDVKKCLINTLDGLSYCKYFKVIYNGELISIDGETPENGFAKFELNAEEISTPSALPGGFLTGALPEETTAQKNNVPASSTEALPPYNPLETAFETSAPYIPN